VRIEDLLFPAANTAAAATATATASAPASGTVKTGSTAAASAGTAKTGGSGGSASDRNESSSDVSAGEDGSFNDGYSMYARFFKPMGITVDRTGNTLWVADFGNNRVRNISCSGNLFPTHAPTAVPTIFPTVFPTEKPSGTPKARGKAGKSRLGGAKGVPGRGKGKAQNIKNARGARGASMGDIASELSSAGVSTTMLMVICVVSGVIAAAGLLMVYYRQRLASVVAGAGKAVSGSLGGVAMGHKPSSQPVPVGISSDTLFA